MLDPIDEQSKKRAYELYENSILENTEIGTLKGLQQIHAFLFDGLFDFAGKIRNKNISKGELFFVGDGLKTVDVQGIQERFKSLDIEVRDILKDKGYSCSLINARFVKPLDEESISMIARDHKLIVTLEENVLSGGYGEHVTEYVNSRGINSKVVNIALPDDYI